jgi:REP element-mobilizing transposase RayT
VGRKENPRHDWESLAHVRWECKYRGVIIPKYRRKVLYGTLRRLGGVILRELCPVASTRHLALSMVIPLKLE